MNYFSYCNLTSILRDDQKPNLNELSKFLIRRNKKEDAKEILTEIISEIESMTKTNAQKYRTLFIEAEKILNEI